MLARPQTPVRCSDNSYQTTWSSRRRARPHPLAHSLGPFENRYQAAHHLRYCQNAAAPHRVERTYPKPGRTMKIHQPGSDLSLLWPVVPSVWREGACRYPQARREGSRPASNFLTPASVRALRRYAEIQDYVQAPCWVLPSRLKSADSLMAERIGIKGYFARRRSAHVRPDPEHAVGDSFAL